MHIRQILYIAIIVINQQIRSAQSNDTIQLPKIVHNNQISIDSQKERDIYIDINNNHELFINSMRVNYWDEIMPRIMALDRSDNPIQIFLSKIIFRIDENVKYRFVSKVKDEIASSHKKHFFYEVRNSDGSLYLASRINSTFKDKWPLKRIKTRKNEFDSIYLVKVKTPNLGGLELTNSEPYEDFYNINIDSLKKFISEKNTTNITLMPNRRFKYKNQVLKLEELFELEELLLAEYLIFVRFDYELLYDDYIDFLKQQVELFKSLSTKRLNKGSFIEVSNILEKKFTNQDLNLFK